MLLLSREALRINLFEEESIMRVTTSEVNKAIADMMSNTKLTDLQMRILNYLSANEDDLAEALNDEDEDEDEMAFVNHYKCSGCGFEWHNESSGTENDRCPDCRKENEPYESFDL